ncbi:MAG: universal stress protein [Nitrososphaerales archaeon]
MFRKILVAVDGSTFAEHAVEYAAMLAKKFGSELVLIHAILNPMYTYEGIVLSPPLEQLEKAGQEVLNRNVALAEKIGVQAKTRLVVGHPADEISKVANEEDFDLLVVGSRGLSSVKAFLLGSVSEKLSRLAKCPVLIVKPGWKVSE